MLQREFVLPPAPASATKDVQEQDMQNEHVVKAMRGTLAQMIDRGVLLTSSSGCLEVSPDTQGELTHSLLCTLLWPFVDSYWVAAIALFALTSNTEVEEATLLERMQWLAETMYHERMICFYESCSRETLRHALDVFYDWGVVCAARSSKMQETSKRTVIRLQPPYTDATQLRMLTRDLVPCANLRRCCSRYTSVCCRTPYASEAVNVSLQGAAMPIVVTEASTFLIRIKKPSFITKCNTDKLTSCKNLLSQIFRSSTVQCSVGSG